jgi:GTP-binding protein
LNTQFDGWDPYKGEIEHRMNGAMISDRKGQATAYAIWNLQERGVMYVTHGQDVFEGMIVGEHAKENDLEVNITREKKLTNVRASGSDEAIRLVPVRPMTLEMAMEWIKESELIEVTPKTVRLRCRELSPAARKNSAKE